MTKADLKISELFGQALAWHMWALGRLITLVESNDAAGHEIATLAHSAAHGAHVVGITGAPGSGKSTLVGCLVSHLVALGNKVGVLAVDPSSPLTGGAILGDRVRMAQVSASQTFIRSMATRGHQGGLALAVPGAVRLLDAMSFDPIIIETVGVGQVEVDVAGAADTTVVVATPGMGDAVQANKSGLLELADLFVVNKSDRPGANDVRRDLELMLDLSHTTGHDRFSDARAEIVMTSATNDQGISELWDVIKRHRAVQEATGVVQDRRANRDLAEVRNRLLRSAEANVDALLASENNRDLLNRVATGELAPTLAAANLEVFLGLSQ